MLRQWFPNFFLSRRNLEKNRIYLAHFEHLNKKFVWICNFFVSYRKIKTILLKLLGYLVYLRLYDKSATNLSVRYMCLILFGSGFNVRTYFRETNLHFFFNTTYCSRSLDFILWSVENPSSHRYDVENCIKLVKAFLANEGYSSLTGIQNVSMGTSACLILSPRSPEIHANSSSSHNRRPVLDELSMKGFRTQSYSSAFSDGK